MKFACLNQIINLCLLSASNAFAIFHRRSRPIDSSFYAFGCTLG